MNLQAQSNARHTTGEYSWEAIADIMGRITGQSFTYQTFQDKYDNDPTQKLQHIVADFNEHGLTLNVNKKKSNGMTAPQQSDQGINSSAMKAANKTIQRNRG